MIEARQLLTTTGHFHAITGRHMIDHIKPPHRAVGESITARDGSDATPSLRRGQPHHSTRSTPSRTDSSAKGSMRRFTGVSPVPRATPVLAVLQHLPPPSRHRQRPTATTTATADHRSSSDHTADPRRAGPARSSHRRIDDLGDLERRGHQSGASSQRPHLARVPHRPSNGHHRRRLLPHRHRTRHTPARAGIPRTRHQAPAHHRRHHPIRREVLDHVLIMGRAHTRQVLAA